MRSAFLALPCVVLASLAMADEVKSIDDQSTHAQTGIIQFTGASSVLKVNAFCLNNQGQIIAVCGNGPGEVRVANDDGKILNSWKVNVKPESVGVAEDDTILVGGEGKLFRFAPNGKLITKVASPHAARLRDSKAQLRSEALATLKRSMTARDPIAMAESRVTSYENMLTQLKTRKESGTLNASEERLIKMLPDLMERYQKQVDDLKRAALDSDEPETKSDTEPTEAQINSLVDSMIRTKMRVSSISSTGNHLFVTTRGTTGYGYDVWKMDLQFKDAAVIVSGLSGCCGQMDVQCCESGIYVAENSRDRVVHYDINGTEINKWGKSDRTGINGFTSCCNPMNVCFDKKGYVYTAESGSGRIKCFDSNGALVSYVGDVDLVPGCKNVSIAVSHVNAKVYMLDLTRNHIKVMEPKPAGLKANKKSKVENQKEAKLQPTTIGQGVTARLTIEASK
ncbi:MAG: hypothetical protein ACR2OA_08505 [Rubripirellula sp.]